MGETLDIGCGQSKTAGAVGIDILPGAGVDIVHDLNKLPWPLEANRFETDRIVSIDMHNPYYRMLHGSWGQKLREVFDSLEDPVWDDAHTDTPLKVESSRSKPLKKITRPDERLI